MKKNRSNFQIVVIAFVLSLVTEIALFLLLVVGHVGGEIDQVGEIGIYVFVYPTNWFLKATGLSQMEPSLTAQLLLSVLNFILPFFLIFIPVWLVIWSIYGRRRAP